MFVWLSTGSSRVPAEVAIDLAGVLARPRRPEPVAYALPSRAIGFCDRSHLHQDDTVVNNKVARDSFDGLIDHHIHILRADLQRILFVVAD
jgi:hypothetical protein